MKELKDIRGEIDSIDNQLVELFKKRLHIAAEVAEAKRGTGKAINDPAREREILTRVSEEAGADCADEVRLLFASLMNISKARQRLILKGEPPLVKEIRAKLADTGAKFPQKAMVAVSGVEGSYAQQATSLLFPLPTILFFTGFEKVFEAVEKGLCPYGILPIENSAAGSVAAVYDLMQQHKFHIVRALRLKVNHVLLAPSGVKLADVREVASHPHALAQCRQFFKAHPEFRPISDVNTAVAAQQLAKEGNKDRAVIASRACADLYGLDVIAEDIADASFNYTRFICISKELEVYPDANKFSIMLSLPHRPGALNSLISKFAAIGVNLTKLESRPIPGMDFEFRFIFDFEARPGDPAVLSLLSELALDPEIEHFTFLGAFSES